MSYSDTRTRDKRFGDVATAVLFLAALVTAFTFAVSPLVGFVHVTGFAVGLALWLARPARAAFSDIKVPYLVALGAFVVHRIDEEVSDFVPAIEEVAGREAADVLSIGSLILVVLSLAWMLSPLLLRYGHPLGQFGAWSVFAGFGVIELWHFVFPLLTPEPYGYFPGMITAPIIAAAGWWGMWRMWQVTRGTAGELDR